MLKKILFGWLSVCAAAVLFCMGQPLDVLAKEAEVIKTGVYAGEIDLSGMTGEEAKEAINAYVDSLRDKTITLKSVEDQEITVTAEELGIYWANPGIVKEALALGAKGDVLTRYKVLKDLEHEKQVYDIDIEYSIENINTVLLEKCTVFDQPAKDFGLKKEGGQFVVTEGETGYLLDVELSIDTVYDYLRNEWNKDSGSVALNVEVSEPRGSAEELSKVSDVLGSFSTAYPASDVPRSANVENGCRLINGTVLYPGDEFSMSDTVSPFTAANGYYPAGSYLNGRVVDSVGGGICQVSTTLYNAVLLAELDITERYNHSMTVSYVSPSADAAIAESAGKDFRFVNTTDYPIYIEGITTPEKVIAFNVYGVETRAANRKVYYESKVLSTTPPGPEVIIADAGQPVGFVQVQGAYTGYKAELWKVVTVDGVETSRTKVNTSSYKMVPRTATIGIATADANAYNLIVAAIATGDINYARSVAVALQLPVLPVEAVPEG